MVNEGRVHGGRCSGGSGVRIFEVLDLGIDIVGEETVAMLTSIQEVGSVIGLLGLEEAAGINSNANGGCAGGEG